jgi:ABC-type amino acid transport substrate-binding protein
MQRLNFSKPHFRVNSMTPPSETSNPSVDRLRLIEQRQFLKIGLCPDLPGMGFWNPEKKIFEGFEAELARCLTRQLLGSEALAEYSPVKPGERLPQIVSGELDMVLSQLTIMPERLEIVDFSDPYLVAHEALLVPVSSSTQGLQDLRGKTVAVAEDTASFHRYSVLHPEINLVTTAKESDGLYLLLAGKVDGVANDNVNLEGLMASLPKSDVEQMRMVDVASLFDPKPFGVCLKKGSPMFLEKLNASLSVLQADGTISRLFEASRSF